MSDPQFKLESPYQPQGDQPTAIKQLVRGLEAGIQDQVLLGATATGKTFTVANIIAQVQRPTLVLAHNKTLVAQLYGEFKAFFPTNAVGYFVSYFDYYQPEAYKPQTDTYIEKDSDINEEIDRLRHAATRDLLTRRDVIIVASVSCIYGLGSVDNYRDLAEKLVVGQELALGKLLRRLTEIQYQRNDTNLKRGTFRLKGDTLDLCPAGREIVYRLEFSGDRLERIRQLDLLTKQVRGDDLDHLTIFPASHYVTPGARLRQACRQIRQELEERLAQFERTERLVEAQRLEQRVNHDLEMMTETGFVKGIENYSRHLSGRAAGEQPTTLFDYFPDDFLLLVDESHMALPQVRGMYNGDQSRKQTLVDYGFRLPSALDNRPLSFDEFRGQITQAIYISATPGEYELSLSPPPAEQVIRPTGLLDPQVEVRPIDGQIDDLVAAIKGRVERSQRVLVTTLTKRMAEDLTDHLKRLKVKVQYLHSEVDTLERSEIIHDLRRGTYDVLVGINLLREGLDLPEVSLVAILDADKEGFLRSETALIQTIGRAARHIDGRVIMYADGETISMQRAITETNRRRQKQADFNRIHGQTPESIKKALVDVLPKSNKPARGAKKVRLELESIPIDEVADVIAQLKAKMKLKAANLEFEEAAEIRDLIGQLRGRSTRKGKTQPQRSSETVGNQR